MPPKKSRKPPNIKKPSRKQKAVKEKEEIIVSDDDTFEEIASDCSDDSEVLKSVPKKKSKSKSKKSAPSINQTVSLLKAYLPSLTSYLFTSPPAPSAPELTPSSLHRFVSQNNLGQKVRGRFTAFTHKKCGDLIDYALHRGGLQRPQKIDLDDSDCSVDDLNLDLYLQQKRTRNVAGEYAGVVNAWKDYEKQSEGEEEQEVEKGISIPEFERFLEQDLGFHCKELDRLRKNKAI